MLGKSALKIIEIYFSKDFKAHLHTFIDNQISDR